MAAIPISTRPKRMPARITERMGDSGRVQYDSHCAEQAVVIDEAGNSDTLANLRREANGLVVMRRAKLNIEALIFPGGQAETRQVVAVDYAAQGNGCVRAIPGFPAMGAILVFASFGLPKPH